MMKPSILFVTPSRLVPASSGGHWRSLNVAQSLANIGYQVTILSLAGRRDDYRMSHGAKYSCSKISDNLFEITDLRLRQGLAQSFFNRVGYSKLWSFVLWPLCGISPLVLSLFSEKDIIIFDSPFIRHPHRNHQKFSILLSHNLETEILERSTWWDRFFWLPIVKKVELSQRKYFQAVLSCAQSDTVFYKQGNGLVTELPNGMNRQDYTDAEINSARTQLGVDASTMMVLFVGSRFQPNIDALKFLKQFVKRYQEQLEQSKIIFYAVGTVGEMDYSNPVLKVTGRVSEVATYLKAADLSINPVTWGSGSNVKVFESLAAQVPIISTPFGLRGLHQPLASELFVFKESHNLLTQLIRLAGKKSQLRDLGKKLLEEYKEYILMDEMVSKKVVPMIEVSQHFSEN